MTHTRKDAGEARQRPKPPVTAQSRTATTTPTSRPAGIAPTFDATTAQLKPRGGAYQGMKSNPVVQAWTAGAAQATAPVNSGPAPQPRAEPQTAPGVHPPSASDAEAAPKPTPSDKS